MILSSHRWGDNPTLAQARKRTDWPEFEAAINSEYAQMNDDEVYDIHPGGRLPDGANLIGSMTILNIKRDTLNEGKILKYKARLVALGNQQQPSSYDNIKFGTARSASVKTLISLQAKTNAISMVMDVKGGEPT